MVAITLRHGLYFLASAWHGLDHGVTSIRNPVPALLLSFPKPVVRATFTIVPHNLSRNFERRTTSYLRIYHMAISRLLAIATFATYTLSHMVVAKDSQVPLQGNCMFGSKVCMSYNSPYFLECEDEPPRYVLEHCEVGICICNGRGNITCGVLE